MLALIGGGMLLCAVGAMILLATWSLSRDEAPDSQQRDGLLAFRRFGEAKRSKRGAGQTQRRHAPRDRAAAAPVVAAPTFRKMRFDPDEMADIEEEAQASLPDFVRASREEY